MKNKLAYMLVGVLLGWGVACGTTNLDSLTLSGTLSSEQLTSTDDMTVTDDATIGGTLGVTGAVTLSDFDNAVVAQSDLGATCTLGAWAYDTGATDELCYCFATDTWACWTIDTIDGPTD